MRPELARKVEEARSALVGMDHRRLEARRLGALHQALLVRTEERDQLLELIKDLVDELRYLFPSTDPDVPADLGALMMSCEKKLADAEALS